MTKRTTNFPTDTFIPQKITGLRLRKNRQATGCVIVEGLPEIKRAMAANVPFEVIYLCRELIDVDEGQFAHLNVIHISKDEFKKIAYGQKLKGILAICRPNQMTLQTVMLKENALVVVCEGVEKPGNLGTVIRSADGANVDCVINCDGKTDWFNQHVVRASIGAVFDVQTVDATKEETVAFLKEHGFKIVATSAKGKRDCFESDFRGKVALLMGSEDKGLSSMLKENADELIRIPIVGRSSSLNMAMSASILMYEAFRQRRISGTPRNI